MGDWRSADISAISIYGAFAMTKWSAHSLIVLAAALAATFSSAQQDINFDDLKREGRPLTKSLVVEGAGRDGRGLLQQFSEVDDSRVESRRQLFSGGSSGSASSSNSSSTGGSASRSAGSGSRSYACEYKCTNAKFTGADKSSMTIRVRAASKSAAEEETIRHGKATCYQQTSRVWDTGSQRCREE